MLSDDFKLVELDAKDSDLLFEVVAAQTPCGRIRVNFAATIDPCFTHNLAVELATAARRLMWWNWL